MPIPVITKERTNKFLKLVKGDMPTPKYIIGKFKDTGINTINLDLVVKEWNHLWIISQYGAEFRLIKSVRKNSSLTNLKTAISADQANDLIERLGLGAVKSGIFRKAITWTKDN